MLKHEIPHPAGDITHWTSDEAAHKALKKRLETPEKVKLTKAELAYGRAPSKKKAPLRHSEEVIDEAWQIYNAKRGIESYPSIVSYLANHFGFSEYQGRMVITEARAKYIDKEGK